MLVTFSMFQSELALNPEVEDELGPEMQIAEDPERLAEIVELGGAELTRWYHIIFPLSQ